MRASRWTPVHLAVVAVLIPLLSQAQDLPPPPLPPPSADVPLVPAPFPAPRDEALPPPTPPPEPSAMPPVPAPAVPAVAPAPVAAAPAPAPEAPTFRPGFHAGGGVGLAFLATGAENPRLGFGLEGTGEFRFTEHFGVMARFGLGAAHFERTVQAAETGVGLMGATAGAYGDLWQWMTVKDQWALFRLMGGFFASVFLLFGFMVGAVILMLSPLAALSFAELSLSPVLHFTKGDWDFFAEGTLGLLTYADTSRITSGWGPGLGFGARTKSFGVRLHLLWAPPGLTTSPNAGRGTAVAGGVTLTTGM